MNGWMDGWIEEDFVFLIFERNFKMATQLLIIINFEKRRDTSNQKIQNLYLMDCIFNALFTRNLNVTSKKVLFVNFPIDWRFTHLDQSIIGTIETITSNKR